MEATLSLLVLSGILASVLALSLAAEQLIRKIFTWRKFYKSLEHILADDPNFVDRQNMYNKFGVHGPKIEPVEKNFFPLLLSEAGYATTCWSDPKNLEHAIERLAWIQENVDGTVCIDLEQGEGSYRPVYLRIYLSSDEEAMAYKLRWS